MSEKKHPIINIILVFLPLIYFLCNLYGKLDISKYIITAIMIYFFVYFIFSKSEYKKIGMLYIILSSIFILAYLYLTDSFNINNLLLYFSFPILYTSFSVYYNDYGMDTQKFKKLLTLSSIIFFASLLIAYHFTDNKVFFIQDFIIIILPFLYQLLEKHPIIFFIIYIPFLIIMENINPYLVIFVSVIYLIISFLKKDKKYVKSTITAFILTLFLSTFNYNFKDVLTISFTPIELYIFIVPVIYSIYSLIKTREIYDTKNVNLYTIVFALFIFLKVSTPFTYLYMAIYFLLFLCEMDTLLKYEYLNKTVIMCDKKHFDRALILMKVLDKKYNPEIVCFGKGINTKNIKFIKGKLLYFVNIRNYLFNSDANKIISISSRTTKYLSKYGMNDILKIALDTTLKTDNKHSSFIKRKMKNIDAIVFNQKNIRDIFRALYPHKKIEYIEDYIELVNKNTLDKNIIISSPDKKDLKKIINIFKSLNEKNSNLNLLLISNKKIKNTQNITVQKNVTKLELKKCSMYLTLNANDDNINLCSGYLIPTVYLKEKNVISTIKQDRNGYIVTSDTLENQVLKYFDTADKKYIKDNMLYLLKENNLKKIQSDWNIVLESVIKDERMF